MSDLILTKAAIDAMTGLQKTHFLNPKGKRLNKSLGDAAGLKNLGVHYIEVQPGDETTEYHRHHFEDECVYILEGRAVTTIDGREYPLGPGDFVAYPAGGPPHTMIKQRRSGAEISHPLVSVWRTRWSTIRARKKRLYCNGDHTDLVEHQTIVSDLQVGKKSLTRCIHACLVSRIVRHLATMRKSPPCHERLAVYYCGRCCRGQVLASAMFDHQHHVLGSAAKSTCPTGSTVVWPRRSTTPVFNRIAPR